MLERHYEACIVPLIGFHDQATRDSFASGVTCLGPMARGQGDRRFFVENVGGWHGSTTDLLTDRHIVRRDDRDKPVYRDLRNEDQSRLPSGAVNTLFLTSGKRSYSPNHGDMRKNRELWEIGLVPRDCYVLWEDEECRPLENPDITLKIPPDRHREETEGHELMGHVRRRACGVVFTRTRQVMVDTRHLEGNRWVIMVRYTTIKVEVLDQSPAKGDAVRMWITQAWAIDYEDAPFELPVGSESWRPLILRTASAFDEHCTNCTPELEKRYKAILDASRRSCRRPEQRCEDSWSIQRPRWG